ncbi:BTB/POZ and TAZ domain-containing protein 4-like [Elaeis guineensis]|uniref:BTB/POZ and TAZ domain-containing protein 4-like n=1 Tax=Elaeis guineensis var. tenera TaxID=51953 RepID=UPI003C6D04E3
MEFRDRLFTEGCGADVRVQTNCGIIPAHASVLGMASPVLKSMLNNSKGCRKSISIRGVPHDAVRVFIRYLYTSCFRQEEMDQFVISLLVLSHCFMITSLKQECSQKMEKGFLTTENVIDVLQLARLCDAPRLYLICYHFIAKRFDAIYASEGWKVITKSNPELAKEIVKSIRHAEFTKQERLKRLEERKIYLQLHGAMEAFIHRDGCRTIGPIDKVLKGSDAPCNYPACKGLESLVRHFARCKNRVLGDCSRCKRMWRLLGLHARLCDQMDECRIPLCRQLKEKMQHRKKKDDEM